VKKPGKTAFETRIEAFFSEPSEEHWDALAHTIIPGTGRTVWQAWIRVDGAAPTELPSSNRLIGGKGYVGPSPRWPLIPDAFTVRRAVTAARAGKVPVGWWWLKEGRAPVVPRKEEAPARKAQKTHPWPTTTSLAIPEVILRQLTGSENALGVLSAMIGAHAFAYDKRLIQFKWKARSDRTKANTLVIRLEPNDTYTMEFWKIRGADTELLVSYSDVYNTQLREIFERETGLYLSL
jgi:hypothetical protein